MSDRDKIIGELRVKLSNIEYAGHELSVHMPAPRLISVSRKHTS